MNTIHRGILGNNLRAILYGIILVIRILLGVLYNLYVFVSLSILKAMESAMGQAINHLTVTSLWEEHMLRD